MNRQRAAELLPIITAFAQGARIWVRSLHTAHQSWHDASEPGWVDACEYCIAPEERYRAWELREIPVGAIFRPLPFTSDAPDWPRVIAQPSSLGPPGLHADFEWKWPHEPDTAWRRCGVMEAAP